MSVVVVVERRGECQRGGRCAGADGSIDKVSSEIETLKAKVQVERTVRAYKEEYESISRVVNQLPSRAQINAYVRLVVSPHTP